MWRVLLASLLLANHASANEARLAHVSPVIDGSPQDTAWHAAAWRSIDHVAIGDQPEASDFSGRYKVVWTKDYLFVLAEIIDDVLIDSTPDPLVRYWEDDTLEILIDEDASGGLHRDNNNAFAYHIALDNQAVDIAPLEGEVQPRLFPAHVKSRWQRSTENPDKIYWEVRIAVHNDTHVYGDDETSRVLLEAGKLLGFMVAYCDADSSGGRELFIGDVEVEPVNGDRNRAYIDAGVFGILKLTD